MSQCFTKFRSILSFEKKMKPKVEAKHEHA